MFSAKTPVTLLLLVLLPACDGSFDGPGGPDPSPPPPPVSYADGGLAADGWVPPASTDVGVAPDSSPPPSSSCPELAGSWTGTLGGQVIVLLPFQVTGSISMTLTQAAQPGSYTIQSGQMVASAVGVSGADATGAITGEVTCGVMDVTNQLELYGVKVQGKVQCTFDKAGTGCSGNWNGQSADGKASGSGTFQLKRK